MTDHGSASQAIDQIAMVRPLLKWVGKVNSPRALPDMVRTALRQATTGRPGPVVLDLPEDVLKSDAEQVPAGHTDPAMSRFPAMRIHPDPEAVARAAALLAQAERPLLLVGGGGMISRAFTGVAEVMGAYQVPLAHTWTGKGIAADTHPHNLGQLGPNGTRCAQSAACAADLILMVGCNSAQNSTYGWSLPRSDQRVIHLDIDPAEIGKVFRTDVGLVADFEMGGPHHCCPMPTQSERKGRRPGPGRPEEGWEGLLWAGHKGQWSPGLRPNPGRFRMIQGLTRFSFGSVPVLILPKTSSLELSANVRRFWRTPAGTTGILLEYYDNGDGARRGELFPQPRCGAR